MNNILDFKIDKTDLSIRSIIIDNIQVILEENQIVNPFYIELGKNNLENIKFYNQYDHIYAICMKDEHVTDTTNSNMLNIFNKIITRDDYNNLAKYFTLVKCSKNMVFNKIHFKQASILTGENLSIFTAFTSCKFENTEIVIPLLEMKKNMVLLYNSLYDNDSISRVGNLLSLNKNYNVRSKKLSTILNHLKESEFWKNDYNCNVNMTELFT